MARHLERLHTNGALRSYSADEALGITINTLMFQHRVTRKRLGEVLGVTGPAVGRKLRGEAGWSLNDLYAAADYFGVTVSPATAPQNRRDGTRFRACPSPLVPPAGFEPATHGYRAGPGPGGNGS